MPRVPMRTETIRMGLARTPSCAQRRKVSKYGALRHAAGEPGSTKAVMCPPSLVTRMSFERSGFTVVATETFPMRGYLRPGRALKPREVAAAAKEAALVRAHPLRAHPWRHEMLRAVAVTRAA